MSQPAGLISLSVVVLALCVVMPSCRRDDEPGVGNLPGDEGDGEQAERLVFPDELRVADESVNEFITHAINTCATGDYDAFRLLWSVRQDPLGREEFERGWQAVQTVRVRALERVMLASDADRGTAYGDLLYVVLADATLDPNHPAGRREAHRQVVLMLTKEDGRWRLARAPKQVRTWLKERVTPERMYREGTRSSDRAEKPQPG